MHQDHKLTRSAPGCCRATRPTTADAQVGAWEQHGGTYMRRQPTRSTPASPMPTPHSPGQLTSESMGWEHGAWGSVAAGGGGDLSGKVVRIDKGCNLSGD